MNAQGYAWWVAEEFSGCHIPGNIQAQAGQGSEQPHGVEDVAACAGMWEMILSSLPAQTMIYEMPKNYFTVWRSQPGPEFRALESHLALTYGYAHPVYLSLEKT